MADLLEDVFGSDLGSDEEVMRASLKCDPTASDQEEQHEHRTHKSRSKRPSNTTPTPPPPVKPVVPAEKSPQQHSPPPHPSLDVVRDSRSRRPITFSDSEDDAPPPARESEHQSGSEEEEQVPVRPSSDRKRRIPRKPDARGKRVKTENGAKSPPPVREDRVEEEDQVERDEAGWRKKEPKEDPYQQYDDEEEEPAKPEKPKTEFQKALEANKAMRRPRRKDADPAKVESECVLFLEKMMKVRDDDIKAYRSGKPALNKLMMIRDVELMCMKVSHREQLMDNMLLAIIKAWLDPMPDGALPNVDIRTSLLTILSDMKVDADWVERLESSQGLGRVIHFLSCKDPHEPNKRLASKLMMRWARPVYQSNANYHDLLNEFDKPDEGHRAPKEGLASDRKAAMHSLKHIKASEERRNSFKTTPTGKDKKQILAAVPRPAPMLYTRLVESDTTLDPKTIRESRNNKARTRKVNRTMFNLRRLNKRNSARAAKPSVNGR